MTSATSLNNKRILNFFIFTLKKQTPLTLLATAFCLLFCPGTLLSQIMEKIARYEAIFSGERPEMENYFIGYSLVIFIVALVLMLLLIMTNFGFLYSKKSGDVFHALPLKRSELLLTRMASSFIGAAFTMSVSYLSLVLVNSMPQVVGIDGATLWAVYGAMLAMLLMLTVFTTVFAVCSGGIFDFIIALGGINIAIPLIYLIFLNFLDNNAYGVIYNNDITGIMYTTPFAFGFMIVLELAEQGVAGVKEYFTTLTSNVNVLSVVIYILFTALCIFAVIKLFNIRKSETAGEAYSFNVIPHIISVLVSIVGGYVLGYVFTGYGFGKISFWFFFIIGIVLCSITAGAIFSRGFKTIKTSLIRGAVSTGIAVIICVVLVFVGGYAESYIPRADDIEKITIGYNEEVVFTDNFDIVIDIHKAVLGKDSAVSAQDSDNVQNNDVYIVEEYKYVETDKYTVADEFDSIRLNYYMKNKRVVSRQYYSLNDPVYDPLFIRYAKSDAYKARLTNFEGIEVTVELQFTDYGEKITHEERPLYSALEPEKAMELMTVYADELQSAPESAFYESCDLVELYGISENYYATNIRVPESFKNTRAVLATISLAEEYPENLKK